MIKDDADHLYIGVTKDPQQRLTYHNERRGAQFTKQAVAYSIHHQDTFKIVFLEEHETLAEARRREIQIKKWRREKKEMLIDRYRKGLETNPTAPMKQE
jgi:predicted GIY-YIG superfamily endonuclease